MGRASDLGFWMHNGWTVAARLQDNDLIFTATKHDKLISTRHAWVFYELLEIDRDGFSAASWQRWLNVIASN